jgi:CubicO group peptidase (beta-lactamase class C family)
MDELTQNITNLVEPEIAKQKNLRVVIGVQQADQTLMLGFGQASGSGKSPDSTTLFEIGSVTKLFTNYGIGNPGAFSTDVIGDRILKMAIAL